MPADERARLADQWSARQPRGSLLLATCHRVEIYGRREEIDALAAGSEGGVRVCVGEEAARHLIRVAVGRDSAVVAEDQILHQLRTATHAARSAAPLPTELDRLVDGALRAGRVARSWLPARRPSLVELALALAAGADLAERRVHVAGGGEMGRAAVAALLARGATVSIGSRTADTTDAAARHFHVPTTEFDPGPDTLAHLDGVAIALKGRWPLSAASRQSLTTSSAWVIDLSAPTALDGDLAAALGGRLLTIDDLAIRGEEPSIRLLGRLDNLVETTLAEWLRWASDDSQRTTADALARRAQRLQAAELDRLWRRMPMLDADQRAEVERAVDHVAQELLREPLEQLSDDGDGSRARAARELFRL